MNRNGCNENRLQSITVQNVSRSLQKDLFPESLYNANRLWLAKCLGPLLDMEKEKFQRV